MSKIKSLSKSGFFLILDGLHQIMIQPSCLPLTGYDLYANQLYNLVQKIH